MGKSEANQMFIWIKRLVITVSFLALIATNILTLTSAAFNASVSGLMSTVLGVQTVADTLTRKNKAAAVKRKATVRRFGSRLTSRTKRVAATSIAAIPAESVPFLGVSLLIAGTGYELYEACQSIKDLDQMYFDLGMDDETPDDVLHSVCNPSLPDTSDVWSDVVDKSGEWWDEFVGAA